MTHLAAKTITRKRNGISISSDQRSPNLGRRNTVRTIPEMKATEKTAKKYKKEAFRTFFMFGLAKA